MFAVLMILLAYIIEAITFIGSNLFLASIFEELIKFVILAVGISLILKDRYGIIAFMTGIVFIGVEILLFILGFTDNGIPLVTMLKLKGFYIGTMHMFTCFITGYGLFVYRFKKSILVVLLAILISICIHIITNLIGFSIPIKISMFNI